MPVSRKKLIAYILLAVLAVFATAGYLVYSQLTDIDNIKATLAEKIEELVRLKVLIGDAELDFSEGLGIRLDNVSLRKPASEHPEITAREIRVVVKLLPLLAREVAIDRITVLGSSVKVIRNKGGELVLAGMEGVIARKSAIEENFFRIVNANLLPQVMIRDSDINFLDYSENPDEPISLDIKNINFSMLKSRSGFPLRFTLQGKIPHLHGETTLDASGKLQAPLGDIDLPMVSVDGKLSVQNFFLPQFQPYVKKVLNVDAGDFFLSFDSRFSGKAIGPVGFTGKLEYHSLQHEQETPVLAGTADPSRGIVNYKITLAKNAAEAEELLFESGSFRLKAQGRADDPFSDNPKIAFAIESDAIAVGKIDSYPPFKLLPVGLPKLVQDKFKQGTIQIRSLKFDGSLEQLKHLDVAENLALLSGEADLNQIDWGFPSIQLSKATGTLKLEGGDAFVQIVKARCDDIPQAVLSGEIKNLTRQPEGNLNVSGNLDPDQLRKILRKHIADPEFRQTLDRFQEAAGTGKVQIVLKGLLSDMEQLAVNGSYVFEGAKIKQQGAQRPVNNLKGGIRFNHTPQKIRAEAAKTTRPWQILLEDMSGEIGTFLFSGFGGELLLGDGEPSYKASARLQVPATEAKNLVTEGIPIDAGTQSFLKEIDFQGGMLAANIQVAGNSLSFEKMRPKVALDLNKVALKFGKQMSPWLDLTGHLAFEKETVRLTKIQGRHGDSPFQLEGTLKLNRGSDLGFDVQASSAGFLLKDLKGFPAIEQIPVQGPVQIDFKGNGTSQSFKFQSVLNLTESTYKYGDSFVKKAGTSNTLRLEGQVLKQEVVKIRSLVYELGGNRVKGDGTLLLSQTQGFSLKLAANNLQTQPLAENLAFLKNNQSGTISFEIESKGNLFDLDQSRIKGTLDLKKIAFKFDGTTDPVILSAHARFAEKTMTVPDGELTAGDSQVKLKAAYTWGLHPNFDVSVTGKKLVLDKMWPELQGSLAGLRATLENSKLFTKGTGRLLLNLNRLDYTYWRLRNVLGELALKNKSIFVNRLEMRCSNDNRIYGEGMLTLAKSKGLRFKTQLKAKNVEAGETLGIFGEIFEQGLSGKMKTLNAELQGEGGTWDEMRSSLAGKLSFNVVAGMLHSGKLENGALHLFGFPESKSNEPDPSLAEPATPYDRISGSFNVEQGIAKTENFLYETADRGMSLVGKFDLVNYEMDTTIGVAPLPGLDRFLIKIPIVGKILTGGDEASLVKNYYSVAGKFDDPTVTSIPLTSLEKKVVGVFQGIFQAPRSILPSASPENEGEDSPGDENAKK